MNQQLGGRALDVFCLEKQNNSVKFAVTDQVINYNKNGSDIQFLTP